MLVPNPSYPIHIYGPVIAGADIRQVPLTPGVDFFAELERAIKLSVSQAEDADHQFPVESDRAVRRAAVLREDHRARAGARHLRRARPRVRRHLLRRLEGAVDHAGAGRARRRGRVLHDVEELQHGGLAHRLHGRQPDLVYALARIKGYHDYGTFTPIQVAAIAALEGPQECVAEIAQKYQKRRDVLVKGLHEAGWMVEIPKASMYVWAKIPEPYATLGSLEFAKQLLAKAKVSVSPGIGFGEFGDGHVRFAMIENESAHATGDPRHQADVPRGRRWL